MALNRADIERRAAEALRLAGLTHLPVDPERVASALGAKLHAVKLEDHVSGVLAVQGAEKHILVNESHHSNRQRFSAAHECGHLTLHHQAGDQLFVDTQLSIYRRAGSPLDPAYVSGEAGTSPQQEREANLFASALLMPADWVRAQIAGQEVVDEQDVAALAQAFGVSEQAMAIRLQQLDLLGG